MIKREVVKYVTIINRAIAEVPDFAYFIALSEQCQF
jgi:hypothetical protein